MALMKSKRKIAAAVTRCKMQMISSLSPTLFTEFTILGLNCKLLRTGNRRGITLMKKINKSIFSDNNYIYFFRCCIRPEPIVKIARLHY